MVMNNPTSIQKSQLDDMVMIAALSCSTPWAFISILGSDGLRITASYGITLNGEILNTPLCNRVIQGTGVYIVEDLFALPEYFNPDKNSILSKFRFYAGLPLVSSSDTYLGVLCVVDSVPRRITANQEESLRAIARQVATQFELKKSIELIEQQHLQMLSASKIVSIASMSSGLAHEINNPLMIVSGKLELLKRRVLSDLDDSEYYEHEFQKISVGVDRVSNIVKVLQDFASYSNSRPSEKVFLDKIISAAIECCQDKMRNFNINLRISGDYTGIVNCHFAEMSEVFQHLINNGIEAVEDSKIKEILVTVKDEKNKVTISIIDSGHGLAPEISERAMDPFFTTKGVGYGRGLGLSRSARIIHSYGGKLYHDPTYKNGAKFVIELPRLED